MNSQISISIAEQHASVYFPQNKCIHQLFQEQVTKTPNHIAVVYGTQNISYNELDQRSNQLARYLQDEGVKPETLVGICLERSINIIISMLAILKAGGAYVPIDPDYPNERKSYMMQDSACDLIISHTDLASKIPDTSSKIIFLDSLTDQLQQQPATALHSDIKPNNLAYIIYTSGSTGKPKGVMIEHRNVVRLFFSDQFQFTFSENDVWSVFHSFCFDFSVWEMYGALLFGGKAIIIPKQATRDPIALINIICKEKVSILNQTPSSFYSLIPYILNLPDPISHLRYIIFGGEKLNPSKLGHIKKHLSDTKFINMYGITETTVHVTYKEITEKEITDGISNIGKPIPTLKLLIIDDELQIVPHGVKGELCVSGAGVARGYLKRDELTAEKFIPNPMNPDEIIYRSGDLALMLKNGDLEYYGRMDNQIQLRGFRIELGEIESVISDQKSIKDCVVIIDEVASGDSRIIAYIIPSQESISITTLKKSIGNILPEYMIPSFFIKMTSFPLTDNGKLDTKKLPSVNTYCVSNVAFTAPQNELEHNMAAIWGDILDLDPASIGRMHDFFDIGGHSLSATILLSRLRKIFKINITIQNIYQHTTLAILCQYIEKERATHQQTVATNIKAKLETNLEINRKNNERPVSSTQLPFWLGTFLFNIKISNVCEAYQIDGDFDLNTFQQALSNVAQSHDTLWCSFSSRRPVFHIHKPGPFQIEYCNNDNQLNEHMLEILHTPFDLTKAPLFRMSVIKQSPEKHQLLVSMPHIISDISSMNGFVHEVFKAYHASRSNTTVSLPSINTTTAIADHETVYLNSESHQKDQHYWQNKLGNIALLELDRRYFFSRKNRTPTGQTLIAKFKLDQLMVAGLHGISTQTKASVQTIIHACIQASLRTLTKQDTIATIMVHDMSGMYPTPPSMELHARMLVAATTFTPKMNYSDLISSLKNTLKDAISHAQMPDLMVHSIPVVSALKHNPILLKCLKGISCCYSWYYGKKKVNQRVLRAYFIYVLGMVSLWLKNIKRKDKDRYRSPPVVFNVLPGFYECNSLWSDEQITVKSIGEREHMMHPGVFEERSRFQDAKVLNIDLLRDRHGDAYLYLWGGELQPHALDSIKHILQGHLNAVLADPSKVILKE